jgi:hypothetical protein
LSQFQKSAVVVPAKAGHEAKRNTIPVPSVLFWTSAFAGATLFNRFEIGSIEKAYAPYGSIFGF